MFQYMNIRINLEYNNNFITIITSRLIKYKLVLSWSKSFERDQMMIKEKKNFHTSSTSSPRWPWNSNFLGIMKAEWWDSKNLCLSALESRAPTHAANCSAPDCSERCLPSSALQCISNALAMQLWNPKSIHWKNTENIQFLGYLYFLSYIHIYQ